ncbi:glucuronate isomerase [Kribbella sandramycini]|uniref:Uronate isomerase n=1 Tax=Kribbella sandramycini TaxID=60450 RepID=A0A7Y4KUJ0_9ACTN|nr:glucuronate isomerase [Kribbella sandramycini]MBB6568440.1 glucuronate isomerase [Kribbella sandramycini]NOL38970.1 glucuronate isomerase [Kribbella sandramycini]
MPKALQPHPDRALPAGPARDIARRIHASTKDLPLLCLHGHVDIGLFAADAPFGNPAELLVIPDHYVTRMLVSQGVSPDRLGLPRRNGDRTADPREVWREFCAHWRLFRGTPSRYWLEHEFAEVLGLTVQPSPETADELYDQISARIAEPDFRPRALLDRFNIELLSTTDAATDDLALHAKVAADLPGRVIPTFRPDAVVHLDRPGWCYLAEQLGQLSGVDTSSYGGYLEAIRQRRQVFVQAGARATDHGHFSASTTPLTDANAERIYASALKGQVSPEDAAAFAGHMLFQSAVMSAEDGLVMQLHPGVLRDHDPAIHATYGPDQGHDIPVTTEFTRSLRPLLERFGHAEGFRLVLFTVDETTYSRELAPLAGVYPAVRLGAPWWFLDSPDGMRRFRELVTETAGFYNTSGFVDDTRAYLSIPARHDLARRIDAGYLADLVVQHRLDEDDALEVAQDLAYNLARDTYLR